jgi:scyllo-inositol 2-dehydrogenase (NADP+)
MPEHSQIRVALIGYGLAGSVFHAPLIAHTKSLSLRAIVTNNPDRMAQAHTDFPQAKVLASADQIWKEADQFDLVVIASPNKFHYPQAKAAMESGLSAVIDKPAATSAAECRDLISISKKTGMLLTVFQNRRWDGDFLTIRKLLDEGKLGQIVRFESRFERFRPQMKAGAWRESGTYEDAGGLLFDLGSHLIDQARVLFGDPQSVYAEVEKRRQDVQVDDDVFVAMQFPSGVVAHLWANVVARIKGPRFRVLGLNGSYEKYEMDPQEEALRAGKRPGGQGWGQAAENDWGRLATTFNGQSTDEKLPTLPGCYERFYEQVAAAVRGQADIPVQADDALRCLELIEAAFSGARDRQMIRLTPVGV